MLWLNIQGASFHSESQSCIQIMIQNLSPGTYHRFQSACKGQFSSHLPFWQAARPRDHRNIQWDFVDPSPVPQESQEAVGGPDH